MSGDGWTWSRFEAVASARGDSIAIVHGPARVTFRELMAAALAQAGALRLEPGARAVVSGENGIALAALVPAIWRRGAIPVMVHADAPARHLAHAVALTEPQALFTDAEGGAVEGCARQAIELWSGEGRPALPPAGRSGADPASILFTSGSTGLPKGVVQSAATLIDGAARMSRLLGYRPDDRILCPIPFAFDYGWGQLLSLLLEGIPLVLPFPRNGFGLCEALAAEAPTVFAGVPAVFADLFSGLAPIRDVPRGSVRLVTNTGSRIPGPVFRNLLELFPDAEVSLNYGLTETYRSASLPVALARSHPESVGAAVPGVEIEIRRPDGGLAGPEEEGEVVHRGAGTFLGYWGDPIRTAEVLRPDPRGDGPPVVFTGDLGRIDADGRLHIHGRRDRQMKSMGVRVSPDEIEALIQESGLVADVAVSSLPHDLLGDMVVACVVPPSAGSGVDRKTLLKALKAHARRQMSAYMQPRLYLVMDALPRTQSAKVDYALLKSRLMAETAAAAEAEPIRSKA